MSAHERGIGKSSEWYTPPYVFKALGVRFDLDVAHPGRDLAPWTPAAKILTADSLETPWEGFVWMNPPFGKRNGVVPWLDRFFAHGNGVALTADRTSAPWWQRNAARADLVLFVAGKIDFVPGPGIKVKADGQPENGNGTGTTLFAAGPLGVQALRNAEAAGLGSCWSLARAAA